MIGEILASKIWQVFETSGHRYFTLVTDKTNKIGSSVTQPLIFLIFHKVELEWGLDVVSFAVVLALRDIPKNGCGGGD